MRDKVVLFAGKAEDGAKAIAYLAAAPEVGTTTGGYFVNCRATTPSAAARNDAAAERLWAESERFASL